MSAIFEALVSSKGQVVIPKPLRDRWGIEEGALVSFAEDAQGLRLQVQPKTTRAGIAASLAAGAGLAGYQGPTLNPAQMRAGLRAAFAGKKP